jgi:hypothetical protein
MTYCNKFEEAVAGAAIAVHTFDDFQQFNLHLLLTITDGSFSDGIYLH